LMYSYINMGCSDGTVPVAPWAFGVTRAWLISCECPIDAGRCDPKDLSGEEGERIHVAQPEGSGRAYETRLYDHYARPAYWVGGGQRAAASPPPPESQAG
jgi:hypothetical protein